VGVVAQVPELRQLATMTETEALALAQAKRLSLGPDALAKADQYVERIAATKPAWQLPCCKISMRADRWNWTRGAAAPSRSGRNWAYLHPPTSPSMRV